MKPSMSSGHFALMPRPVIDPQWLMRLPAYLSDDGQIVRAVLKLLDHAWRASPAGSLLIQNTHTLAELTGLSRQKTEESLGLLQQGWKIAKNGSWTFEPIEQLAQSLLKSHKESIEFLANELLVQAQSPDLFGPANADTHQAAQILSSANGPATLAAGRMATKAAVKRLLPDSFMLTASMLKEIQRQGIDSRRAAEVQQLFVDFARSRAERSADWDATFRNWLHRAIKWQTISPDEQQADSAQPQSGFSFGQTPSVRVAPAAKSARARDDSYQALQRARQVVHAYAPNQ